MECALIATLPPGAYTVILRGQDGGIGAGQMDACDLEPAVSSTLANTSMRGLVHGGDDVLIAGFIISNGGNDTVLVSAIGPSLGAAGVANPPADPTLDFYDGNGTFSAAMTTGAAPTRNRSSARTISLRQTMPKRASFAHSPPAVAVERGKRRHRRRSGKSLQFAVTMIGSPQRASGGSRADSLISACRLAGRMTKRADGLSGTGAEHSIPPSPSRSTLNL